MRNTPGRQSIPTGWPRSKSGSRLPRVTECAMPFIFADAPHVRKHGPGGYERYQTYKDWLRDEFTFRCVYCLERERWYPSGHAGFGVDHVKPKGVANYAHLICS